MRAEDIRQRLLRVPTSTKSISSATRTKDLHRVLATPSWRRSASPRSRFSTRRQAERGHLGRRGRNFGGPHQSARHRCVRWGRGDRRRAGRKRGRVFRLGDIATVKRGYQDPATFVVRQGGRPAIGLGVVDAKAPTSSRSARTSQATAGFMSPVPVGIEVDADRRPAEHRRAFGAGVRRKPSSRRSASCSW